ncbi:unnamed protein product [Thlaspi arvense]|uniref:Protein kinase domain-containing protein n=1 Tax=Thlaspi arvense TaxID=13288 RepID=A0AAU9RUK2_THLAR|nr:unnamed protein product [Thlaspi arvense]
MWSFLRYAEATVPLSWSTRMMIALGAAKGLAFLHNAERPVIYRDFKTSNILLDSDYTAKLSDFGLAKAGPQGDETHVSTRVMGTYGYAAPEYVMTGLVEQFSSMLALEGHLTARSDVYSFGVVLLELLTGRKSVDKTRPSREQSLVDWARPKLNDKRKLLQIIDPRLENQYSVRAAQKACSLAYYCLSQNPKARPLMSDVVETLEPLQSSKMGADEVSSSSTLGFADYNRMHHHNRRYDGRVGAGAVCRSPNPNCSPGGPAACRENHELTPSQPCRNFLGAISPPHRPAQFQSRGMRAAEAEAGVEEGKLKMMKPVVDGPIDYRIMGLDDLLIGDNSNYYYLISNNYNNNGGTRRRLAPFQVCLVCNAAYPLQIPPPVLPCLAALASIATFQTSPLVFALSSQVLHL